MKDEHDASLPGVRITARSPDAPPAVVMTDRAGAYRLVDLPPGTYTVSAELDGFATRVQEDVIVRTGVNVLLSIVMRVGPVSEIVNVHAEPQLLESSNATQAINIGGELQRQLPLSGRRHWADSLILTPGITTVDGNDENQFFFSRGAHSSSNVILIDGADSSAANNNSPLFVGFSAEAIQDVQTKTGGLDASTPLGLGAVITVATRSGTNRVTGSGDALYRARRWNGRNVPGGISAGAEIFLPDLSIGGPIVRDRAWFYGAYRYSHVVSNASRSADQLATLRALVPGFEPDPDVADAHYTFVKGTMHRTARQQLLASYNRDRYPSTVTGALSTTPSTALSGGNAGLVRLSSIWTDHFVTRAAMAYNDRGSASGPDVTDRTSVTVFQRAVASAGRLVGSGNVANLGASSVARSVTDPTKLTITWDGTYDRRTRFGAHELQSGLFWQPVLDLERHTVYVNNGQALDEGALRDVASPSKGFVLFHRQIYDVPDLVTASTHTTDTAFYVQDVWRVGDRLTINGGVRVDVVRARDRLFDVQTMRSTNVGPRLGINYALTSDRRNVIRASVSRVHEVVSQAASTAGTTRAPFRDLYDLDADGVFETTFPTPASTQLTTNRVIDLDGWNLPRVVEYNAGYQRQFSGQWVVDLSFTRREFRGRAALIDRNGIYTNGVFQGYRDESQNEIYQLTNNVWNWPVYSDATAVVSRQAGALRIVASYLRQWRHLTGTWQPNDPASFIQPDAFPNNRGIGATTTSTAAATDSNSLNTNAGVQSVGPVSQWQNHTARAAAIYSGPWGLTLSTDFTYQSGAWSGPIFTQLAAPDPRFGPASLRLSNGRLVSNPLATVFRFACGTRGDCQLHLPAYKTWNARVGRRFALGPARAVEVGAQFFNLANAGANTTYFGGANLRGPSLGNAGRVQPPRTAELVIRVDF